MFLIPIGRDDAEIRRHAFVSYAIIALNILAFVAVETATRGSRVAELQRRWDAMGSYLLARPYLRVPAEVEPMLTVSARAYLAESRRATLRTGGAPSALVREREQAALDGMAADAVAAYRRLPHIRFGYVPSRSEWTDLVTSMFVHAGLMHLIGNLLFFFVSGPFVEDVFGRPLFASLYFLGGITASLTYGLRHPAGVTPLVGASGAIAAIMGAYLVRFVRSKVEFLFVPLLLRPMWHFRFFAPAFVVLPLWFIAQWMQMQSEASGGGVAFSAHVGGFLFGMAAALVVKLSRFEEKFVNPVVVQETTWSMDPRTLAAMESLRNAQALEDDAAIDAAATELLARYTEDKQSELALDLIREVADGGARLPKFLARSAPFVERTGDREWAVALYRRLFDTDPSAPQAVQSLVRMASLMKLSGDLAGARESLTRARAHPACPPDWASTIDAKITALRH